MLLHKQRGPVVLSMGTSSSQLSCVTLGGPLALSETAVYIMSMGYLGALNGMMSGWPGPWQLSALGCCIDSLF